MNGIVTSRPVPVVTVDGPVGSGKGTISSRLAARLGWHLLDSGALYRLVALQALENNIHSEAAVSALASRLEARFMFTDGAERVFLGKREVTLDIRRESVGDMASRLAIMPAVRAALVERQRAFRVAPGLVADGRDMGTVIFPDAELKIFLTASVEARALRRYKQLKEKGESVNLSRLFREIKTRDERDSQRAIAPLKPAEDAVIIDSTELNINEVVQIIEAIVEEKSLNN